MAEVERIESSGNGIRIQMGQPAEKRPEALPTGATAQQGGTVRVLANGEVQYEGVKRSSDAQQSSDPLDTARDAKFQMRVPRNAIKSDTLIRINGVEAPASAWEESGHLVKDANGNYSIGTPPSQQDQPKEQQQAEPMARLSEAAENTMTRALDTLGETTMQGFATAIMEGKDAVEERMVNDAASRFGIEPQQMRTAVERVKAEFVDQAQRAVSSVGVPAEEWDGLVEWLHRERPNEVRDAMRAQVENGRLGPLKALAQEYATSGAAFSDADLLNTDTAGTGYRIFQSEDGRVIVDIPRKGQMEARAAIKAGLLPLVVTSRTRR
jgi:hypothetical protein